MSDIFHPLVAPLTTYTYTTGSASSDTVSATDEERLPPGGFSLRHGFSHWFGRAQRSGLSSANSSRQVSNTQDGNLGSSNPPGEDKAESLGASSTGPPSPAFSQGSAVRNLSEHVHKTSIVEVLHYVKQAFDDETALDTLPLEAAGNAGAWKAWRAYRISKGSMSADNVPGGAGKKTEEWNWDGVWEERVRRGIDASISEAVLYGGAGGGGDDLVRCPLIQTSIASINDWKASIHGLRRGSDRQNQAQGAGYGRSDIIVSKLRAPLSALLFA